LFEKGTGLKRSQLSKEKATEEAIRMHAPRCRYLHLATHGFFAPESMKSALSPNQRGYEMAWSAARDRRFEDRVEGLHPGVLSGIALAGANRGAPPTMPPEPPADDGIFTASEVAMLDLKGVDLVVLSACETSLGATAGGEGMIGLQRAFQVAGARTVIASLWKVDDTATQKLMEQFYRNLWEHKMGKLEALESAQKWLMKQKRPDGGTYADPYYWAAFVLSGDWR
jgi:CHAT domain-containing protein